MDAARKPSALFVYFTYTRRTLKVVQAMAEVLRDHIREYHLEAARKFTDGLANRLADIGVPQ